MDKQKTGRDVIVVGGSEGALEALARILASLPQDFRASLLAVVTTRDHAPTAEQLAEMQSRTPIPLAFAKNGDALVPGRLSVCPPSAYMAIDAHGIVKLTPAPEAGAPAAPVDALFTSAARAFGPRVVAVVLSGGSADGVAGLRAVGKAAGVGIVQSPSDAIDPRAPVQAVVGDHPDTVAMLDAIAPLLMKLSGTPHEANAS